HNKKIIELEAEIEMLKGKINLQTRKRQIANEEVEKIKELRASGLSYRAIAKETGWSNVTINRVINGIYD
ncbi:MAG: helix-turn-helix domain-containing protein, partial [Clostridium sp.]